VAGEGASGGEGGRDCERKRKSCAERRESRETSGGARALSTHLGVPRSERQALEHGFDRGTLVLLRDAVARDHVDDDLVVRHDVRVEVLRHRLAHVREAPHEHREEGAEALGAQRGVVEVEQSEEDGGGGDELRHVARLPNLAKHARE
jgi:hypothetical protein